MPTEKQMVTVWPIDDDTVANQLNTESLTDICQQAVQHYGLLTSQHAIHDAKQSNASLNGRGPYLLAWSPAIQKGRRGSLVLIFDMTNVTTLEQAKDLFFHWSTDIQESPQLWQKGWNMEKVKLVIRLWADKYGTQLLALFGGKG